MKFSTIVAGAFAAVAAIAAPSRGQSRSRATVINIGQLSQLNGQGAFNLGAVNNFQFVNADLGYLFGVQGFDVNVIAQLAAVQNLQLVSLQSLVVAQTVDIGTIVALTELRTIHNLAQQGVLQRVDLGGLQLAGVNALGFGLLGESLTSINLGSLIDPRLVSQAQNIALNEFGTVRPGNFTK